MGKETEDLQRMLACTLDYLASHWTFQPHSLQQGKSSSTGNLLDKDDLALPPPDYGTSSRAFPTQTAGTFKQRPYSVAVPAFSQVSPRPGMDLHEGNMGLADRPVAETPWLEIFSLTP